MVEVVESGASARLRPLGRVGLVLLLAHGLYRAAGVGRDLWFDLTEHVLWGARGFGLPPLHEAILTKLSGFAGVGYLIKGGQGGIVEFVSQLETAYAISRLVIVALFLVVVAIPFRRRRGWAWAACWLVVAGDLGEVVTFGSYSRQVLVTGLVSAAVLAVLLLAHLPVFVRPGRTRPAARQPSGHG